MHKTQGQENYEKFFICLAYFAEKWVHFFGLNQKRFNLLKDELVHHVGETVENLYVDFKVFSQNLF